MSLVQPKNRQAFRYLYLLQSDGIGTQYSYISQLLDYAVKADCKVIVDCRKMAFFLGWGVSCEEVELNKVFSFDTDKVIYSLAEIDRILCEQADQVLGVRFCREKFDPKELNMPYVMAEDLLSNVGIEGTCALQGKLSLVGEHEKKFQQYQQIVTSSVGVHARLGNGEQHKGPDKPRMNIAWERYFAAMDAQQDEYFFVCTDTPSFLEACINRYGDKVISMDRFRPPENCGPGHNTWSVYDEEKKAEYIEARNQVGPYRMMGDALVEMFLLGDCKRLICNQSAFTHYARVCRKVEAMVLDGCEKSSNKNRSWPKASYHKN